MKIDIINDSAETISMKHYEIMKEAMETLLIYGESFILTEEDTENGTINFSVTANRPDPS